MIVVVADTSPLNYLIQIHCEHVLPALYEHVFVPTAVVEELNHPRAVGAVRTWLTHAPSWLMAYFGELGRFEDFIVHEAAHIFHNCKRQTMGLPESSAREWPLDIAYDKRETFAYSCEAFSRIVELGGARQARLALVRELADGHVPETDRFDAQEYVSILTEAAGARNGWKHILSRCAPSRHRRR